MTATKEAGQGSAKLTGQQKLAQADDAARKIIAAESLAREKKTEKLKQLRLQKSAAEGEAAEAEPKKAAAPAKKKKK